ncbi:hypothetical protein FZC76_10215 [Sutcliffiella horikoshii]|uniref:Uncharacterized protein n=1 Tax=Sutcliffiella horikoshii TaxID=79883 RepID=A0A5D4SXD0_9BACI|nr:hypothetical protein [Sutcliffiella horikoshii]TYS68117.1 hypothetical protein FZC76_10215 [Sutcliffiella horikoshii]
MNSFLIFLILILTIFIDYYWLDTDRKRWGWMKNWSTRYKVFFFIGFIAVSSLIYLGLNFKYF